MSEKPIIVHGTPGITSEETCASCDCVFEVMVEGNFQPVRCPDCGKYTMACNECDNHNECGKCDEICERINANQPHDVKAEAVDATVPYEGYKPKFDITKAKEDLQLVVDATNVFQTLLQRLDTSDMDDPINDTWQLDKTPTEIFVALLDQTNALRNMIEPQKPSIVETLKAYKEGKMYLRLLHGRNSPDEEMEGIGFDGPTLFCDWVHITYNSSINFGYEKVNDTGPLLPQDNAIFFHKDMIACVEEGATSYYGDWSVDINEERKA